MMPLWQRFHFAPRDPGTVWHKEHRVVIEPNGHLDGFWVLTPHVVQMPSGGYRLYYTGVSKQRRARGCLGYILSAVSQNGVNWQKEQGIRVDNFVGGGEVWVYCPDVIFLPDGSLRLYFQAKAPSGCDRVFSAVSQDGLRWIVEEGARFSDETHDCGSPRCLLLEDGRYRLYFHFNNPKERGIASAISENGLNFKKEDGYRIAREGDLESHTVYAPEVLRLGTGGYRMYYAAWTESPRHGRILSAFSDDGFKWQKDDVICVDIGGAGEEIKVSEPCVMLMPDGSFRMHYEACDAEGRWRIFAAKTK